MSLRFVSHKEISFRHLLAMLRAPPVAVMNYYSNLFTSAKFILSDQPAKVRLLEKEIRRVECMVGVKQTPKSREIQEELQEIMAKRERLEKDQRRIESMYDSAEDDQKEELITTYKELDKKIMDLHNKEHYLLFKLEPLMPLKTMETYMDNNLDLKSFFKENGKVVTQLELMSELDEIKNWIYKEATQIMPYIRFTKLE